MNSHPNFGQIKTLWTALLNFLKSNTANWLQNDSTAIDYIKNKPFYEEPGIKKTVLLAENNIEITDDYAELNGKLRLEIGKEYTVTFQDIEYKCVAWQPPYDEDSTILIGNGSIYGGDGYGDIDLPFSCDSYSNGNIYLNVRNAGVYSLEIAIIEDTTVIHKIDKKFLPTGMSDWEQNDSTASDYIKNRTHYSKVDVINTLVPPITISNPYYSEYNNTYGYTLDYKYTVMSPGKKYRVLWDGVEYFLTADTDYYRFLGNASLYYDEYENTGEPFVFYYDGEDNDFGCYCIADGNTTHTISIEEVDTVIKTLDKKYLPKELQIIDTKVNANSTNLVQNKAIVDYTINGLIMKDQKSGYRYIIQIIDGTIVSSGYCTAIRISDNYVEKDSYVEGELIEDMVIEGICEDGSIKIIENFTCIAKDNYLQITCEEAGNIYKKSYYVGNKIIDIETALIDFDYIVEEDGTYTLTDWKGTYNGETSTRCIIPNSILIRL